MYDHDQRVAILAKESQGPALNCIVTVSDTHGVRECGGVLTDITSERSGGSLPVEKLQRAVPAQAPPC